MPYKPPVDKFYFLRTGKTPDNRDRILADCEWKDKVGLTEEGTRQALTRADWLANESEISLICHSPVKWAEQTARYANGKGRKSIHIIPELQERLIDETNKEFNMRIRVALGKCFHIKTPGKILIVGHESGAAAIKEILGIKNPGEIKHCVPYQFIRIEGTWEFRPEPAFIQETAYRPDGGGEYSLKPPTCHK